MENKEITGKRELVKGKVELIGVKLSDFKEWFFNEGDKDKLEKISIFLSLQRKGSDFSVFGPFNIPIESNELIFKFTPNNKIDRMPHALIHVKDRFMQTNINYLKFGSDDNAIIIVMGYDKGPILEGTK